MKKALYLFFTLLLCLPFVTTTAHAAISYDAFRLIRISVGEQTTLAYLFPALSTCLNDEGLSGTDVEAYKFFLRSYVNIMRDNYNEKAEDGVTVTDTIYYSDYDAVGFTITFDSNEAMSNFFGGGSSVEGTQSGLFFIKTEYEIPFPFSSDTADSYLKLASAALTSFGNSFDIDSKIIENLNAAYQDCKYEYVYISSVLRSDSASKVNGLYYSTFTKSYSDLDSNILIYTSYANRGVWYLAALLSVLAVIIPVEIYLTVKRK